MKRFLVRSVLVLGVILLLYIVFPKTCRTDNVWGLSCTCLGYESPVTFKHHGMENVNNSICIGIRTELVNLE